MSRCRQRKNAASTTESRPKPISMCDGQRGLQRSFDEHLAAHDGVDRDVQQQPGQHGRDGRRTFRVRIGQPVVQRREPDLGPVADEQEDEREAQDGGLELAFHGIQMRPQQRAHAFGAQHLLGGEVQQDRAEERLRDADAAQNEVLPARLEARRRPVQRDQQHGRERRRFHRDPQQPHVVGGQRDQHRRHEELVHAVVEAQAPGARRARAPSRRACTGARRATVVSPRKPSA